MGQYDELFAPEGFEDGYDETEDPVFKKLLGEIQGNILRHHGQAFAAHVFVKLQDIPSLEVREWIADAFREQVTAANAQHGGTLDHMMFMGFSRNGYQKLGALPPHFPEDRYFEIGMAAPNSGRYRHDNVDQDKAKDYGRIFDIFVILASNSEAVLEEQLVKLKADMAAMDKEPQIEMGHQLFRRSADDPIEVGEKPSGVGAFAVEHFGYRDGISQPLFFRSDVMCERDPSQSFKYWNAAAPLSTVLIGDRAGYGSFLAFQKLEQDVAGFRQDTEELAKIYHDNSDSTAGEPVTAGDIAEAGAKIMGRYEDGTPAIAAAAEEQGKQGDFENDFNFDNVDPLGIACPFHSHVRRINPRHGLNNFPGDLVPRIARRGMPYGAPANDESKGLLFMSMQAQLSSFDTLLLNADNLLFQPGRTRGSFGSDSVIGKSQATAFQHTWQLSPIKRFQYKFSNHVKFLGGGYFHFPSMAFWKT